MTPLCMPLPTLDGLSTPWKAGSKKSESFSVCLHVPTREAPCSFLGHSSESQLMPEMKQSDSSRLSCQGGALIDPSPYHNFDFSVSLSVPQGVSSCHPWLTALILCWPKSGPIKMFLNSVTRKGSLQNKVLEKGPWDGLLLHLSQAFLTLHPSTRCAPVPGSTAQLVLRCYFCFTSLGNLSLKFLSQVYAVVSLLSVSWFTV